MHSNVSYISRRF